jgi:hypothetical protein
MEGAGVLEIMGVNFIEKELQDSHFTSGERRLYL